MLNLQPLNNYVLVEKEKEEEKTKGGLYMPQVTNTASDILKKGLVKAVSTKIEDERIKIGSIVYFNKLAVTSIPEEENQVLVRVEDLYAIID